jgi:hypothetical protein
MSELEKKVRLDRKANFFMKTGRCELHMMGMIYRGRGEKACIFAGVGPNGLECLRFGSMHESIQWGKHKMRSKREPFEPWAVLDHDTVIKMKHEYEIQSNAAGYQWQCTKCSKVYPYPDEIDISECPGAPCLCAYNQVPNVCPLHS